MSKIIVEVDVQYANAVQKVTELNKELETQKQKIKELKQAGKEQTAEYVQSSQKVSELKDSIRGYNSIITQSAKATTAKKGSMQELSALLAMSKMQYKELSEEERLNAQVGGTLLKSIQEQDAAIKALDGSIGNHQRNVGNYKGALKETEMSLGELKREFMALKNVQGKTAEETALIEQRMGKLKDAMNDANARVKVHTMEGLQPLVASLQAVVAHTQVAVGAISLYGELTGKDTEKLQQFARVAVEMMSIMQGLTALQEMYNAGTLKATLLKTKDLIVTGALAVANGVAAAAQWAWTIAVKAFNATVYNIPVLGWLLAIIGAIIAAVIAVIKYWDKLTSLFKSSADQVDKNGKKLTSLNEILEEHNRLAKEREGNIQFEIELMKAQGKSIDEIKKKERELLLERIKNSEIELKILLSSGRVITAADNKAFIEKYNNLKEIRQELVLFDAEEKKRAEDDKKAKQEQLAQEKKERQERATNRKQELDEETKQRQERAKIFEEETGKAFIAEQHAMTQIKMMKETAADAIFQYQIKKIKDEYAIKLKEHAKGSAQYKLLLLQEQEEINKLRQGYIETVRQDEESKYQEELKGIEQRRIQREIDAYNIATSEEDLQARLKQINDDAENEKFIATQEYFMQGTLQYEEYENIKTELALKGAQERSEARIKEQKEQQLQNKKQVEMAFDLGTKVGDIFADSLTEQGLNAKKFFANIALLALDTMQLAVTQAIFLNASKNFATLGPIGLLKAAGEAAIISAMFGAAKAGIKLSLQGLATGGYVTRGGLFEVGEKGREVVALPAGATVYPNQMARNGMANINIPNDIDNTGMLIEAITKIQPIVSVEEINRVTKLYNQRTIIAEL